MLSRESPFARSPHGASQALTAHYYYYIEHLARRLNPTPPLVSPHTNDRPPACTALMSPDQQRERERKRQIQRQQMEALQVTRLPPTSVPFGT